MKSNAAPQKRTAVLLFAVCSAALALRLALAFQSPNIAHPDQIFQVLEPAHRLVYGYGIVPWEFREGVRSWILPGLFAIVFRLSDLVLRFPGGYLIGAVVLLSLVSLSPVVCGFLWAYRLTGERAALLAGGFVAVWFELAYFATKSLSEVFAAHVLIAGLFLAFPGAPVSSRLRLATAGFLAGLALVLRIQLLPAIVVIGVYVWLVRRRQPWHFVALGFVLPVIGAGLLDWATWGHPWQSIWKYVYINSVEQRSEAFGVRVWYYYLLELTVFWSAALLPMLGLIWLGARRLPLLAIVAATILISHSLVGHKEYRFIYPALAMLIVLAGVGFSDLVARFRLNSWPGAAACLLAVTTASALLATRTAYRDNWTASQGEIRAFQEISADPHACGVLLWQQRGWTTPGYTGLHRDIPIYEVISGSKYSQLESAGNYLVTRTPLDQPVQFTLIRSFATPPAPVYLYHRQGGCSPQHLSERLAYPDWYGERERTDP